MTISMTTNQSAEAGTEKIGDVNAATAEFIGGLI
jgi:hypothetical protein